MKELKVEINAIGTGKVKTLALLLSKNMKSLPNDLQSEIKSLLDSDVFEYDADWYNKKFGCVKPTVVIDGVTSELQISSWNPHLKLVKYHCRDENENPIVKDGAFVFGEVSPDSFELYAGDALVVRW